MKIRSLKHLCSLSALCLALAGAFGCRTPTHMALTPSGMAPIPSGSFTMGDAFNEGGLPTNTVYLSAYYMDRTEVTKALWDEVYAWAINHDYQFDNAGMGKATNHPVQMMSWYDTVKWCNARSEKENRTPAYYTDAGLTLRYRTGRRPRS